MAVYLGITNEQDVGHKEFIEAFIEFVEAKGWYFGGGTVQIDEDGNKIADVD
ncbi:hypothetical protein QS257_05835 [Terrilactibacillus sp. S3-3]|nr:hypothetical protein QS257_05835 [Terrilactibacillus sp. S3-3]